MTSPEICVTVDGRPRRLPAGATVLRLVEDLTGAALTDSGVPADGRRLGVAVAVAGEVVPRGAWSAHVLSDGAVVDVVTAAQGG